MFPILAYSQTEVIKIAENQDAQLELIDQFIDERAYVNNIESIKADLVKNDSLFVEAITCSARLEQTDLSIKTLDEKILQLDKLLSNEVFHDSTEKRYRQTEHRIWCKERVQKRCQGL